MEFDVWRSPIHILSVIVGILLVVKTKLPWPLKLLSFFVVVQTLYIGFNPNYQTPLIPLVSDYVRIGSLQSVLMLGIFGTLIIFYREVFQEKYVLPFYAVVFTIDQGWLMISGNVNAGLMTAGSQSAGLLMCLVPFFSRQKKYWPFVILAIIAMIRYRSATAGVCLATLVLVYTWYANKRLAIVTAVAWISLAIKMFLYGSLSPSGRLGIWKHYLNFWDHSERYAFGLGLGSWDSFSRFIPVADTNGSFAYFIFHNDWLQILVESGFVGLFICLIVLAWMLKTFRNSRESFASTMSLAAMMCFYSPLRFLIGQIFLVFLISRCLNIDNKEKTNG